MRSALREAQLLVRSWAQLHLARRVAQEGHPQQAELRAPEAGLCAQQAAAPSSRAPAPCRVLAAVQRRAVEGLMVWLNAERAAAPDAELAVGELAQPDAEPVVAAAQSDVPAVLGVAQPGEEEAAVQPDVAVLAVAQPGEAVVVAVRDGRPEGRPSELPWAWAYRQDPVLPSVPLPSAPTARAKEWSSSVAWPSTRSWLATLFLDLSCAFRSWENFEGREGQ